MVNREHPGRKQVLVSTRNRRYIYQRERERESSRVGREGGIEGRGCGIAAAAAAGV